MRYKETAIAYRLYILKKYKKELNKWFVKTPSRQEYIEEIQEKLLTWKSVLLTWPTWTGKTALAIEAIKNIQKSFVEISWKWLSEELKENPEFVEVLSGNSGTRPSDFIAKIKLEEWEKWGTQTKTELWKVLKAFVEWKIPVIDEIDLIPNDVLMRIKHLFTLKPWDYYSPQENWNEKYRLENTTLVATANIKSEKHQDREELDPAIVRLFDSINVNYFPEDEIYDLILASLSSENWFISWVKKEELIWDNSIVLKLIYALKEIERNYLWIDTSWETVNISWSDMEGMYLQKAVLETWKLLWFFKWFKTSWKSLEEHIIDEVIDFVSNWAYPKEDRLILIKIFSKKWILTLEDVDKLKSRMTDIWEDELKANILLEKREEKQEWLKFIDSYELANLDPFWVRNLDTLERLDKNSVFRKILSEIDAKLLILDINKIEEIDFKSLWFSKNYNIEEAKQSLENIIAELLEKENIEFSEEQKQVIMTSLLVLWLNGFLEKLGEYDEFKEYYEKIKPIIVKLNWNNEEQIENNLQLPKVDYSKIEKREEKEYDNRVTWVVINPLNNYRAISIRKNTIIIENEKQEKIATIENTSELYINRRPHLSFHPKKSNILVYIWKDNKVKIYDLDTGETKELYSHEDEVTSVTFSPDGTKVISWWNDNKVMMYDLDTGETKELYSHEYWVNSVTFSPDGTKVISWWEDNKVKIYDLETGETKELYRHEYWVNSVTFSPDGTKVISWWGDNKVKIYDLETGETKELYRHEYWVNSVTFSPDGTKVISWWEDNKVKIYDLETGETKELYRHEDWVNSVTFSPDGTKVISWWGDNKVIEVTFKIIW